MALVNNKIAISSIVTTVLTVLISVVLVTSLFLAGRAILSRVNEIDKNVNLQFVSSEGYTVWDNESRLATVQVERGMDESSAVGIDLMFDFEGSSVTHFTLQIPKHNSKVVYKINLSQYSGELTSIRMVPVFIDGSLGKTSNQINLDGNNRGNLTKAIESGIYSGDEFVAPTEESGAVIVPKYFGGGGGGSGGGSSSDGGVIELCGGCSDYVDSEACSFDFCGFGNCVFDGNCKENVSEPEIPMGNFVYYYVDSSRASNGNGSEINPWKNWGDVDWGLIDSSLTSDNVTIYFSSRDTWSYYNSFLIESSGNSNYWLKVDGDSKYNMVDLGDASWQDESGGSRATLTNSAGNGGDIKILNDHSYIYVQGFMIDQPTWGGVNLGTGNLTTNIDHIVLDNLIVDSPVNNHGIWFGYAEDGCSDITVKNSIIMNTPLEGIYMGHYNYMGNSITGVVIENNTLIDCGLGNQGDIDIKPAVNGAIIRGNKHYRTSTSVSGSTSGVVYSADNCQIYNNEFYSMAESAVDWGFGIYVNADGDGAGTGQGISSCLIYNNLIYDNDRSGIKLTANTATAGADLTGVRIFNNVVWGNLGYGVQASASGGREVRIEEMKNNIIGENALYDAYIYSGASIVDSDYNLYYRTLGSSWYHQGEVDFSGWNALGHDLNGIVSDPGFVSYNYGGNNDFRLTGPLSGVDLGTQYNLDINGNTRSIDGTWDVGAYEYYQPEPFFNNIYFVDNTITDCSDYEPETRSCGSGNYQAYDMVYKAALATVPGDTVFVRGGDYNRYIDIAYRDGGGDETGYVNYVAYPGDSRPIVWGFSLQGMNYTRVIGFEIMHDQDAVDNNVRDAISSSDSNRNEILNNYLHRTIRHAINANGWPYKPITNLIVRGNIINYTSCPLGVPNKCVGNGGGISVGQYANGSSHNLIEYNTMSRVGDNINTDSPYTVVRNNHMYDFRANYSTDAFVVDPMVQCSQDSDCWGTNVGSCDLVNNVCTRLGNSWCDDDADCDNQFIECDYATGYCGAFPHPDMFQPLGDTVGNGMMMEYQIYESNFMGDAHSHHAHILQMRTIEDDHNVLFRGNVGFNIGSYCMQSAGVDNVYHYSNTFFNTSYFHSTGNCLGYNDEGGINPSIGNYAFNNIFYSTSPTSGSAIFIWGGSVSEVTASNNICFESGSDASCVSSADPLFVDSNSDNFLLQSSSPARDIGGAATTVTSVSGSGTQFDVAKADFFTDGHGIIEGDLISIGGGSVVRIVDISGNTITVDRSISWSDGDSVDWRSQDSTPDAGAYGYKVGGYDFDVSLTGITNLETVSGQRVVNADVTNPENVRFVMFYLDGIPVDQDYDAPYSYTFDSASLDSRRHFLRAEAYNLYASDVLSKNDSVEFFIG